MYLSHTTIERMIDDGKIVVSPSFDKNDLRPVGIRIHLAKDILVSDDGQEVDLTHGADLKYREIDLTKEDFYLEPDQFVLGATYEAIHTPPDILAILDGRSTVARLGLTMHVTASVIDGTMAEPHVAVLEIKNAGNFRIRLKYKDPIAMMLFARLDQPVEKRFVSMYEKQHKVTPPNLKQQGR
jgi:dCTP deaminase